MGKFCQICEKGNMYGNNVSHSVRRTRRVFSPNTQRVRAIIDGAVCHVYVCTRCLRSGKVQRAL